MKAHVLKVRPTQFAVGMAEVEKKVSKLRKLKDSELENYLDQHRIPIVLAPDRGQYMIDHHHLVRACWEVGIKYVKLEIKEDLSHLKKGFFWKEMKKKKW